MDRSLDSIGSCSLDVDADSFEISDTSGSLNPPCPKSVDDISKDIKTNRQEHHSNGTNGVSIGYINRNESAVANVNGGENGLNAKPSYLNLACCVNGYSNLTTYDSKIRQDLNKSREVSPIRPSCNSISYCKKMNSLAPPVLLSFSKVEGSEVMNENNSNGDNSNKEYPKISFVQQRVELLYGPGALVQNFYSPRKTKTSISPMKEENNKSAFSLKEKFEQIAPPQSFVSSKDKASLQPEGNKEYLQKNFVDLPVLRHLNEEFRAQLPIISPKKYSVTPKVSQNVSSKDEIDKAILKTQNSTDISEVNATSILKTNVSPNIKKKNSINGQSDVKTVDNEGLSTTEMLNTQNVNSDSKNKNGHHFLRHLKEEQSRLLLLAEIVEKKLTVLSNKEDVSENTLGLLRAASGKARLLVSQKMKQFEGLCYKNLNETKDDCFPTTNDDLQGFWDMVCLQISDIDSNFREIDLYEQNDWKKPISLSPKLEQPSNLKQPQKRIIPFKSKSNQQKSSDTKQTSEVSAAALRRESQRKQLLEMKRKQRLAMASNSSVSTINPNDSSTIEIFINTENS